MKFFFLRLLRKLRLISFINTHYFLTLSTKKFKIPVLSGIGLELRHISVPWMGDLLKKLNPLLFTNKEVFIDVGVNTGQTLLKLKSLDIGCTYYGFEPNPYCVYYLNELIRANSFSDTYIVSTGLSANPGIEELFLYYEIFTDSSASTVKDFRGPTFSKKYTVPIIDLDSIFKKVYTNQKIGILKIDVEGEELGVLQGSLNLIRFHKPVILLEVLPVYNESNTKRLNSQNAIEAIFSDIGYKIYRIIKKQNKLLGLMRLSSFGIHQDEDLSDYIIISEEKESMLKPLCLS
jgi:FkbM family methyltransferase